MYRKMYKTIHRNCACIQPALAAYRTELKGKPTASFERALNSGLEMPLRFYIYLVFIHDVCL
jgi:hypothetical protein